jgi:DNA-binding response OmpR family regulator
MSVRITGVSSSGVNDSSAREPRDARTSGGGTGESSAVPRTILIVDDDEGVTQTFARMLRLEGYQVHTAISAEMGLQQAELSRPDAIILDLRMPLLDGLGFLRRLRAIAQQRETPVAIVTGDYFLDESVSSELQQLGAELKFKPIWLEDLVGLARTLLKVAH